MKKITLLILLMLFSLVGHTQVIHSEDFSNGLPGTWTVLNVGGTQQWAHNPNIGTPTPNGSVELISENVVPGTGPYQKWLVTPAINLTGVNSPRLSFDARTFTSNSQGDKLKVMLTVFDANDLPNYVLLEEFDEFYGNSPNPISPNQDVWGLHHIDLSGFVGEPQIHIAFVVESTGVGFIPSITFGDIWAIDNVFIAERCMDISDLTIRTVGQTYANLSWEGSSVSYQIEVVENGTNFTGVPTHNSATNSIQITGLISNKIYKVRVRANCNGVYSDWSEATFETALNFCGSVFSDPGGPDGNYTNNERSITVICPDTPGEVVNAVFTSFNTEANSDVLEIYAGPVVDPSKLIGSYSGTTIPPAVVATLANGGCLTFSFRSDLSVVRAGWTANITCVPGPACSVPEFIRIARVNSNSATLNWSPGFEETEWEVVVQLAGTGNPGAATPVVVTSLPYVVNGLTASTVYEVFVRAKCNANLTSDWTEVFNFETTQIPAQLPYLENFDGGNITIGYVNGTQTNKWFLGGATFNSSGNSMYITNNNGVNNAYTVNSASTVHFYRDIEVPTGVTLGNLKFDWKAAGQTTFDRMRVWLVPSTFVPTVGTAITANNSGGIQIGGNFSQKTTWTSESIDVALRDYAGINARLVFEWVNNASTGTQPPAAVDNINFSIVTCPSPTTLVLENVSQNTATITFTAGNVETNWEYVLLPQGSALPNENTQGIPFTANPLNLTGLVSGTPYTVYIRAICSSTDKSEWSEGLNFNSLQIPAQLPYIENFDGANINIGISNGNQVNQWFLGTATFNSPGKSMYVTNDNGVSNAYTTNVTQAVHFYRDIVIPAGAALVNLSFDWKNQGESTHDRIRVWATDVTFSPTPGTELSVANSNGVQLTTGNLSAQNTWQRFTSDIDARQFAGRTIRVIFEWRNDLSAGTQPPGAVDNINISLITCPKPTALILENVSQDTATIAFTAGNVETNWEYFVTPQGAPAPDDTTQGTPFTTNPLVITGLTPGTPYTVYIRATCSATEKSVWSDAISFNTVQIPAQLPYLENFDGGNVTIGLLNGTQTNKWALGGATFNSAANSMYISNDNGVSNAYTVTTASTVHFYRDLEIPTGVALGNLQFDWKAAGQTTVDRMRVWLVPSTFTPTAGTVITVGNSEGIQIGDNFNQNTNWTTESIDVVLRAYAGTTARIVFEWVNNATTGTQPPAAVDNINFSIVSCPRPTALILENISQDSATISFTAGNVETNWEYIITAQGAPMPDATATGIPFTTNPVVITGLLPGTPYTVYIRAICSTTDISVWSGGLEINTTQIPAQLPYFENFDGGNINIGVSNGTQVNQWILGGATFNSAANSMYISNDNGISNAYTVTTASTVHFYRDLAIPTGVVLGKLQFDWKAAGQSTLDRLRVWLVPSTYTPTAGTAITAGNSGGIQIGGNFNQNTTWTTADFDISLRAYAGNTARIVFEWVNNATTGTQPPAAVDNINFSIISCPYVSDLDVTTVTENSVTLNWTAGDIETQWEVIAVPQGGAAPDANTIGQVTTAKPFVVTGLNPNTNYTFYVRPICSDTDKGTWKNILGITGQIPAQIPYDEQFNTDSQFTLINGTLANKWAIGSATFTSAGTGLYISNDNGATNDYVNTTSRVHAYRDIALPANASEINIAFDWKAVGERTNDYLRVFIVPTSYNPVANTAITAANSGGLQIGQDYFNSQVNFNRFNATVDLQRFANQNVRLVFQWINDSSVKNIPPAAVDNLVITIPDCAKPTNLLTSAPPNSSQVTLTWNPGGNETQWEVNVVAQGSGIPTTPGVIVNEPSYVFNAQPEVFYEYYVRAICGNSNSNWAGPYVFSVFTPPGCASIDVVGLGVNIINNQVYICPDTDTGNVTLEGQYFGIGATTSYEVSSIDYSPPFPSMGGNVIPISADDDYTPTFSLPFNFCFFGNAYNSCKIGDNGVIVFGEPYSDEIDPSAPYVLGSTIPDTEFPVLNAIYGIYQDTYLQRNPHPDTQINYQVLGNYPCRALVVNFNEVPSWSTSCTDPQYRMTTQIVLYEISNIIEVYVEKRVPCLSWQSGEGVIGIQNGAGTQAYTPPGRNTGAWTANNEAWRFTPNGPSDVDIRWEHEGVVIGTNDTVTLPVTGDTQVTAFATYQACDGSTVETSSVIDIHVTREMPTLEPKTLYICPGQTSFDLTVNEDYVLSESNANLFNVYFYETEALAIANDPTTAILDPENYIGTHGQTIWMNVLSLGGCSVIKQFELSTDSVNPQFTLEGNRKVCLPNTTVITVVPQNYVADSATYYVTDPNGNVHTFPTNEITLPINDLTGNYIITVNRGCETSQTLAIDVEESPDTPTANVINPQTCDGAPNSIEILSPLSAVGFNYTNLFISEITDHETGELSYLELFNGTANTIDLSNYKILVYNNGNATTSCESVLSGSIASGDTYVIAIGGTTNEGGITPDTRLVGCNGVNDDDRIVLADLNNAFIDVWGNGDGTAFTPTPRGYVYRRLNNVNVPSTTFNSADWTIIPNSDYSNVGTYVGATTTINYEYSIDGGNTFQTGTIFNNIPAGNYEVVVREVGKTCISAILPVEIIAPPVYGPIVITSDCENSELVLTAQPLDNSYLYQWTDQNGLVVGTDNVFKPTEAGVFTLTITYDAGCTETSTFIVDDINCSRFIPKGISPNGDGLNDNFDISGLRAKSVKIYNRYGTEVYSHGPGYTNQWFGQSKGGNDLPDATYYYVIEAGDGEIKTGWVYISREVR